MTALRTFASPAAARLYDEIDAARSSDQLDHLGRALWRGHCDSAITDTDAEFLQSYIDRQRPPISKSSARPLSRVVSSLESRFKPRGHRHLTDEQRKAARERRRVLGGSGVLPPQLRCHYTQGQSAVLAIIAGEVKHHGICDLHIDRIAALAGVGRTTVQTTMHEARRRGHIKITLRPVLGPARTKIAPNRTNVVEITSPEWRMWLQRGPTAHRPTGSNFTEKENPTKSAGKLEDEALRAEAQQRDIRGVPRARSGPPRWGGARRYAC